MRDDSTTGWKVNGLMAPGEWEKVALAAAVRAGNVKGSVWEDVCQAYADSVREHAFEVASKGMNGFMEKYVVAKAWIIS